MCKKLMQVYQLSPLFWTFLFKKAYRKRGKKTPKLYHYKSVKACEKKQKVEKIKTKTTTRTKKQFR